MLEISSINVALLQTLFDFAPDMAFFVKDVEGRYVTVNESLVKRHGLTHKAEVIGKRPIDICPGDFGKIPTAQDERVLRTGKPLIEHLELQWRRPNDPSWCLTTKLPIRSPDNRIIGLIGFSRDLHRQIQHSDIPADFANAMNEFERELSPHVSPAWLAENSHISAQQLARLTDRLFSLTPSQLIMKIRLTAASRMLIDSDRSVSEIAHAVGYCDHSAFTRALRKSTGMTPSQVRDGARQS